MHSNEITPTGRFVHLLRKHLIGVGVGGIVCLHALGAFAQSQQAIQGEIATIERQQHMLLQGFMAYAIDSPISTACAITGVGNAATVMMRDVDPDVQNMLKGAGVLCTPYCIFATSATCVEATKVVTAVIGQYGLMENRLEALRQRLRPGS